MRGGRCREPEKLAEGQGLSDREFVRQHQEDLGRGHSIGQGVVGSVGGQSQDCDTYSSETISPAEGWAALMLPSPCGRCR
jgi:hypothetical protein